ncbi:putative methyltransferase [Thioalkalivibrio nitratireducens DSM 14787]|uniref:Ribosomal RNA small subunit methyltransferase J n=1 Tax=Thioalkalivibrio nitratireducens (strain DSM 14787 / UNIQEM 213 / ALEN2) TaxID=1255043 RepID=L0DXN8_THIND|nr:class I SAM-dependent methyltransferase [Thioalkalivibrio nitratireducens]AGA33772.1 putative methyltransferase [Thioalkalivibrio nitratireducens DSM 14787]
MRLVRSPGCGGHAQALAEALLADGQVIEDQDTDPDGVQLHCGPEGLSLVTPAPRPLELRIDFTRGRQAYRLARAGHAREDLLRALGTLPAGSRILDASAGLGRDALVLAARGFRVLAFERHPVLAALLEDALHRAQASASLRPILDRIDLRAEDVRTALGDLEPVAEAAIFDPMFPARAKDAAVKKEMQILQQLIGADPDPDAPETLAALRRHVRRRVVVKRPLYAPPVGDETPAHALRGRSIRFDVYLPLPGSGESAAASPRAR